MLEFAQFNATGGVGGPATAGGQSTDQNTKSGDKPPAIPIGLQRIYVKDLSFEIPGAPDIFQEKSWQPKVSLELRHQAKRIREEQNNHLFEVGLLLTVTVKNQEKVAFIVELNQSGLFLSKGVSENDLGYWLGSYCPAILFPYAREVVSDVVSKGSFPQLLLAPVDFDALLRDAIKQQQAEQQQGQNANKH